MNNLQNFRKNTQEQELKQQVPNYQLSGIQSNYTYNGVQNLNFDTSSISQSGYENNKLLTKGVNDQQKFVNNYNEYKPSTTFSQNYQNNDTNSSNLENLKDHSQYNIEKNFETIKPLSRMLDTKNKDNTLYANLNENLMKESIMEVRLNIDSMDRNIIQYPDPFNYIVTFGPVVNSGINTPLGKNNIKSELRDSLKNNKNKNITRKEVINTEENFLLSNNSKYIVDYTDRLKRSFDPYITRNFDNIKFIRLDNVVLPRFNCLKLNEDWDFCKDPNFLTTNDKEYIKDDYERIKKKIIHNHRYIPDDNLTCSLFTDRFIQIYIKEIESNYNLGTNAVLTKAFTVFPDKQVGILYWRGNPYYAVKTYKDSLLGVINRLSIQFYDSWGIPITLNTKQIDAERDIILGLDLFNPEILTIDSIDDDLKLKSIINKFTEIIKCVIFINKSLNKKIPFYDFKKIDISDININNYCTTINYSTINLNTNDYDITDIYKEFNDFIGTNDFITSAKNKKNGKREYISIDNFINNVIWYNYNMEYRNDIMFNLETLFNNYKSFLFKAFDKLKIELMELPINPYFQNHLTFTMGMYTNELNTKIDFYQ
jgi:hypothetical protein